jgi:hypothetical protein
MSAIESAIYWALWWVVVHLNIAVLIWAIREMGIT